MLKIEPEISNFCHFKMVLNVLNSQPSSFPLAFVWPLSRHSVRVNVVRFCSKRSLKGSQWFNTSKNHSKFPVIAQARQIWTWKQTILRCMYPKYVREAGSTLYVLFEVSFIYSERYRAFLSQVKIPYFYRANSRSFPPQFALKFLQAWVDLLRR